ncbi:IFN protein, partial [Spelaeornis formosus]|nr:IFN protein [Elachura formosa]
MAAAGCAQPCLRPSTLTLLLLLITALATGLPCHHLRTHGPGDAVQLLRLMAPNTTQICHLQEPPFFPDILTHNNLHPHQAAAITLRILQHLFHTLSSSSSSQHWHSQPRNQLLNKLQHHMQQLEQCLPDNGNGTLFKGPRKPLLAINKYFRDMHLFLHAHNHSACAWDHVRLEALDCFRHVDRLIRRMR